MSKLPEAEYRKSNGLCYSDMKELLRSAAHYKWFKDNPTEPTKAMLFGRAVHMAILTPDESNYVVMDDSDIVAEIGGAKPRATNAYKAWLGDFEAANKGKDIISLEDHQAITAMSNACYAHNAAGALLRADGLCETSLFWKDEKTKTPMKARLDKMLSSGRIIDIKTCEDARQQAFERSMYNYSYFLQSAVYTEAALRNGYKLDAPFTFICVESKPPYGVAVYEIEPASLELGLMAMRQCIDIFAECTAKNEWPGYCEEIKQIALPQWAVV